MEVKILRKITLGFIYLHVLHHANEQEIFGRWMIDELQSHGYEVGPSTVYPLLKEMIQNGLLTMREEIVEGKIRKYYRITPVGNELLIKAKQRVNALISEVGGQPDAILQ